MDLSCRNGGGNGDWGGPWDERGAGQGGSDEGDGLVTRSRVSLCRPAQSDIPCPALLLLVGSLCLLSFGQLRLAPFRRQLTTHFGFIPVSCVLPSRPSESPRRGAILLSRSNRDIMCRRLQCY
ncbi:hypothetical protein LZ30DRAFT_765868 [Colletotrichum cereale]|nr:hypothetical protein LZ30DRAFT_765868 [Colletotrichum cereale]